MSLGVQVESGNCPSREELFERAKALVPRLQDRAKETEELRRLPDKTIEDLFTTGMLRILQPARFGGYEMDWAVHADAARIIAWGCPSTAWIVSVVGAHAAIVGRLPELCQKEVWGENENQLTATASARVKGCAVRAKGGYDVSGVWRCASGVDHSEWCMISTYVEGEDTQDHSKYIRMLIPIGNVNIIDTWFVSGMRGTGSKDISCTNVFVPEHLTINAHLSFGKSPPGAKVNSNGYLYDVAFLPYFGSSLLGPMIGAAEGAYEAYRRITTDRKSVLFGQSVAAQAPVQQRLAESSAEINAAHLIYNASNALLHKRGQAREDLKKNEQVQIGRDRAYVAKLCTDSVTRLVRQMGAIGIFDDNPVQRYYRDISSMATQVAVNWDRNMTAFGGSELGVSS